MTYTEPLLTVFLAVSFAGLFFLQRGAPERARRMLRAGLIGLFLISWPPADWLFSRLLEWPYRNVTRPMGSAQAIVVLSSHVDPPSSVTPLPMPDEATYRRCRYAAWLYREWRPLPMFVSGGGRNAAAMAEILADEGIPNEAIFREEVSANTFENAKFTTGMLRHRGMASIALVVEADSMLRAEWCFRKQGMNVVPAPFGHRIVELHMEEVLPSWTAVRRNERTLHEIGGLIWYKLAGRI